MSSSISSSERSACARRFTQKLLIAAVLGFVLVLAASEWMLRTQAIPNDAFYKQHKLFHATKNADIVAFGDSHMSQGFDAPPGMLNLGLAGDGFDQIADKIEAYLATHPAPQGIILQLAPHMFANYRFEEAQRDYKAFLGGQFSLQTVFAIADPVLRVRIPDFWYSYLLNGTLQSRGQFTAQGSLLIDYTMSANITLPERREIEKRILQHTPSADFMNRSTDERMQAAISNIKKRGIRLCLVSFPVTPIYRQQSDDIKSVSEARTFIRALARKENTPYFSYHNLYSNYDLFRNLDHLNRKGARAFTPRLLHDCFGRQGQ